MGAEAHSEAVGLTRVRLREPRVTGPQSSVAPSGDFLQDNPRREKGLAGEAEDSSGDAVRVVVVSHWHQEDTPPLPMNQNGSAV